MYLKLFIISVTFLSSLYAETKPTASKEKGNFYKAPGLFSTRPSESKSLQEIKRFGPVGLGFELIHPVFTLRIANVEEGSPAAATGKFKKGQIVETVNGAKLADIDPRIQLGQVLARAEATDGVVKLKIKGGSEVTVKIPVLGAYSKTWPLNCSKSDKIVRQAADYLKKPGSRKTLGDIGMLLLLSTGDKDDLEFVRQWARKAPAHKYPWYLGYGGIPLTECYLRTGDPEILARIQEWVTSAVKAQHNDAWAGRGSALTTYGSGHLNASGTHVVTFLLLAKECGADVPDHALQGALHHFYRYAGRGNNPYGDGRPEIGFVDNGKNGKLAFAMAAAASLTGEGENSVYAKARDICAMQSFYTTTFMLHGHTGGGIGEIWRSASMGFLHEKKSKQYREFMDNRKWHYDMSRRFDGSFGILGGSGYDKEQWGMAYVLTYTMPKKTLRITGAPRTKYSKTYKLPETPWGTKADNTFVSLEAVPGEKGKKYDFSGETLANDSSLHFLKRFHGKSQSDDEIRKYIHHHDYNYRYIAAYKAAGINVAYLGKRSGGGKARKHLIKEFLEHKDARVRHAMLTVVLTQMNFLDKALFDKLVTALKDSQESWAVKDVALRILGRSNREWVIPHVDLLLPYLKSKDWWMQNSALSALAPIAVDKRCYEKVLPVIGELVRNNQRIALTRGYEGSIRAQIKKASPEIRAFASKIMKNSFTNYAGKKVSVGGQDIKPTFEYHLGAIAGSLADIPGGYDLLYEAARLRQPNQILPYKEIFLRADPKLFGEKLRAAIAPIIKEELIPEYVGRNRINLQKMAESKVQNGFTGGTDVIDGLTALHKRAGQDNYEWRIFADLRNAEWSYHSFDPIKSEQVPYDQMVTRYRKVTMPKGMENWFSPTFNPAKSGWNKAQSPFGNYKGKIPTRPITKCSSRCTGPHCYGAMKINTLWEKEVLLLHGKFKVPAVKSGHRYRLRINDGNHVGSGGGYMVYINGKPLIEATQGGGRGSGSRIKGAYITEDFLNQFNGSEMTVAVKSFIRYNDKYKSKPSSKTYMGKISLHFEEQKLPPMGDDLIFKAAGLIPLMSSEWQDLLHSESNEVEPEDKKYLWGGKFVNNPKVTGSWKVISDCLNIADFNPSGKFAKAQRPTFTSMAFADKGKTNRKTWFWSGNVLMDLDRYQALKIVAKNIGGTDYLFIEAGGFSNRNKPGWKSKWLVLKK